MSKIFRVIRGGGIHHRKSLEGYRIYLFKVIIYETLTILRTKECLSFAHNERNHTQIWEGSPVSKNKDCIM